MSSTRQPKALRSFPISSKFSSRPPPRKKTCGLFRCNKTCVYHSNGFVKPCKSVRFGRNKEFHWKFTRFFNCESENVIYVLKCAKCWKFYIGETKHLKKRISKHKSDVKNLQNTNCVKLALHLRSCSKLRAPFFHIYPMYYVDDQQRRRFIEKRFIMNFNPPLNEDRWLLFFYYWCDLVAFTKKVTVSYSDCILSVCLHWLLNFIIFLKSVAKLVGFQTAIFLCYSPKDLVLLQVICHRI